jgi:hypothetical protein
MSAFGGKADMHSCTANVRYWPLADVIGTDIHPIVPWMLSFVSGATIIGFLFGRTYTLLPGKTAAIKGLTFGLLGWMVMGLLFFPSLMDL